MQCRKPKETNPRKEQPKSRTELQILASPRVSSKNSQNEGKNNKHQSFEKEKKKLLGWLHVVYCHV